MSEYRVDFRDLSYTGIPESWIEHGRDHDHGSPRVFAVSVARSSGDMLGIRYASRDGGVWIQSTASAPNPSGEGLVPSSLANAQTWPRSIVPPAHVEPVDHVRDVEREHLRELWSDRVDELQLELESRLITDGGHIHQESDVLQDESDVLQESLERALQESDHDRQRMLIREALQLSEAFDVELDR